MTYTPVTVTLNSFAFDGTTQSPAGVKWDWQDLSGWFDTPDQRFVQQEQGIGVTVTVDRRNGRPITLTALCSSPNPGMKLDDLLYAGQRALKAAVSPSVDVPVLLSVNEPSVPLQAYVRQAGPIRSKMLGTRHMVQFQVPLLAADPRRYAQTAQSHNLTSGTTTLDNNGDIPSPPIFTITGPGGGTGGRAMVRNLDLTDDPQIAYDASLGGGDVLVIDVAAQTVILNGTDDVRGNLSIASWFEMKPGGNRIDVNSATNVSFRDAYS